MGSLEKNMSSFRLKIRDLTVGYSKAMPLNKAPWNFDWVCNSKDAPSKVALLGDNGRGKTTLLKALLGEKLILSGKIEWEIQAPLLSKKSKSLASYCAYLPQEITFDAQMRVDNYLELAWFSFCRFWKKPTSQMQKRLSEVSNEWGLVDLLEKNLGEISSGQRQRASLARVILQDKPLFIFDEPTSYLDPEGQEKWWSWLAALPPAQKVILVSHEREKALKYCSGVWEI